MKTTGITVVISLLIFFAVQPVLIGKPVLCALWAIAFTASAIVFIIKQIKRRKS